MSTKQQTLKAPISFSGKGLHTGVKVTMTVNPAEAGTGIVFRRTDLEGQPIIPALCDNVVDTSRGTTVEAGGHRVHTIEHIMSALWTLGVDNALIDIDAAYAQDAVIELSKMMRYVLYESGHEAITLEKDIQFMENYIKLMRIRYTEDVDIRFDYPNDLPHDVTIPPLLLIVFVENAFKHGVSYNHPSFIRLKIEYADGQVTSTLTNSRHAAQSSKHPAGIGLENVRKRLELIYGAKNYSLEIREEEKTYTVKLVIPTLNA